MIPIVANNWVNCKFSLLTIIVLLIYMQMFSISLFDSIVVTVSLLAQHLGCYKMSLDCKDKLIKFYESLGYVLIPGNSNSMTIRYDESPAVKQNLTALNNGAANSGTSQTVSLDFNS